MQESLQLVLDSAPFLLKGTLFTLELSFGGMVFGLFLGFVLAMMRLSHFWPLSWLARFYVSIFRGTPLLVQILLIYFGLPRLGIALNPVPAALTALTLFSASYLSENFRSGINSVDKGQWEACHSMGMGYFTCLKRIILPQAFRIALPPLGSRLIALMKDTSLASTVTVMELTRVAEQVGATTFLYMEMFLMVGCIYWIINQILTIVQIWLEGYLTRHM